MAAISLHGVRRVHPDGTAALAGVDLEVLDGTLLGVIGPSGSGKSTLLRVIAGLEPATDGLVRLDGRDVTRTPAKDRDIPIVAQQRALHGFLDVAAELTLPLRVRGASPQEVERRTDAERRAFGLGRIWDRRPTQMSAGDAQRTSIARAMVRLPGTLLLDEPLQLLDPPTQVRLRRELLQVHGGTGMTMLVATNDHNQVLGVADRVVVLRSGRVAQVDTAEGLLLRPRSRFVAGFVGDPPMTFVEATVEAVSGVGRLVIGEQRLRFPGGLPGTLKDRVGGRVVLGARPDAVRRSTGEDPHDLTLLGRAGRTAGLGSHDRVTVDVGAGAWDARFPAGSAVGRDQQVTVTVDVRRLHVFDPVDGGAIWHPG